MKRYGWRKESIADSGMDLHQEVQDRSYSRRFAGVSDRNRAGQFKGLCSCTGEVWMGCLEAPYDGIGLEWSEVIV